MGLHGRSWVKYRRLSRLSSVYRMRVYTALARAQDERVPATRAVYTLHFFFAAGGMESGK